jgi:uncharacterized protein YndB with AHSA1/START domain
MREFHGTAGQHVDADPDDVFALITDIDRLPEWNAAIESVADRPGSLLVGDEWVVIMHPPKLPRWRSRSTTLAVDPDLRQFAYRTRTDDGNPSYIDWTWSVVPDEGGAQVVVSWDADVKTFGRRLIAAPMIRRPGLRREVPASLESLRRVLESRPPTPVPSDRNDGRTH